MKTTIDIKEKIIQTIKINECHEPLVDLKTQQTIAYGPPPDTPLTKDDYTLIRTEVYKRLCAVQHDLPNGWKFRLYEGLRSLNVQKILFEQQYDSLKKSNGNQSEEETYKKASLLIAPITFFNGAPNTPPHSTGGAVDIEIIDNDGNLVDFGMAIKEWNKVDPDICKTYSDKISQTVAANRETLITIMSKYEFVNYPYEWWHFSYGDRLWAYLTNQNEAIYGGITHPHDK